MAQDPTPGGRGEEPRDPGFSDAPTYTDSGPLRAAGPGPHDPENPVEQPDPEAVTYVGGSDESGSFNGVNDDASFGGSAAGTAAPSEDADRQTYPGGLKRLADRYQLEEPIASGGAAIVWRAFDEVLSRSVAIKLLHPHLATDTTTVERFRLESINAARLTHPNVVAIYDTGQQGDIVYLVMEFVDGPSLRDVLRDLGPLEGNVVAALGEQVAKALGEAHAQGVVHRDVKPANILLTKDGVAKVTDFGIAKALSGNQATLTSPGTVVGTAAYVAPEQLEGHPVDARADVYALGVVLYECITGKPAFTGDTPTATAAARLTQELMPPRQVRADVPRSLDDVVVRSTRRDASLRYSDGTAMAAALAPLVHSRPSDVTAMLIDGRGTSDDMAEMSSDGDDTGPLSGRMPATRGEYGRRLAGAFLGGLLLALVAFFATQALRDSPDPSAATTFTEDRVSIVDANTFDPYGPDDGENDGDLPRSYDGDPATAWTTETYRQGPLSGKPGVGVWYDLGESLDIRSLEIDAPQPGATFSVYAADALPEAMDRELGWGTPLQADIELTSNAVDITFESEVNGRYWLIWFTDQPTIDTGGHRSGISEIRFGS